jgi:hypothetical protein
MQLVLRETWLNAQNELRCSCTAWFQAFMLPLLLYCVTSSP